MKRVLIVTYYYPPAGGAPVQRVLKFTKYLRAFGWEPVVLTVENGAYASLDPRLEAQVPEGATVVKTKSWDPFRWYARLMGKSLDQAITVGFVSDEAPNWKERLARWIRANVFIPDARVGWVPYGRRAGRRLLRDASVDALISTGPPHSAHLIARTLHRRSGLPWVVDLRDPWTEIDFQHHLPQTFWSTWGNARLERAVLQDADVLITVSPTLKRLFEALVPGLDARVIYNGFDAEDFEALEPEPNPEFVLTHAGSMNRERNSDVLWRVIHGLRAEGRLDHARIRLLGSLDVSVQQSLERLGLLDITRFGGQVSHREALRQMMGSALLLVVVNRVQSAGMKGILPTKVYEYMGAGRPILGIGPVDGDLARVLADTGTGRVFDFEDASGMRAYVLSAYDAWMQGPPPPRTLNDAVLRFTRRAETHQLADLLNELTRSV